MSPLRLDPYMYKHPKLLPLLKDRRLNETVYRCMVCGRTMTTSDLQGKQPWQRGKRASMKGLKS
jgi:hypothetical protein